MSEPDYVEINRIVRDAMETTQDKLIRSCGEQSRRIHALEKELESSRVCHTEDMRVTNESAHFHMMECKKLRGLVTALEKELELARDEIKGCNSAYQVMTDARHEVVIERENLIKQLHAHQNALKEVLVVANGENQVADDDTEGMRWIVNRINSVLGESK